MSLFMLTAYGLACALVYHLFPRRFRWGVLLACSYGFYAARAASGLPFLLLTTASTWFGALMITRTAEKSKHAIAENKALSREEKRALRQAAKRRQRIWLYAVLALNFALLAVLKYTDDVRGFVGAAPLGLLLPLGISFYTFQSMGYIIDVYGGKYAPERNPAKFALYVSFFPQLIQGPIGRYDQLSSQLTAPHDFDYDEAQRGILLILWGLFKKMVIADRAFPLVEEIFSAEAGVYGGAAAIVGVLMYSLQQYCDFSGGIDLVTGIARQFGVQLAPNFRRPYFSVSLGDFWRRWHISLGSWMRDYVFYPFALTKPVGALSKRAKRRFGDEFARALPAALGNILVFLLVGVWHGATANYVLWGLYNGVILAFSALAEPAYKRFGAAHAKLTASRGFYFFRVLRTFIIVNIGWFFDRCATGGQAVAMIGSIFADLRPEQLAGGLTAFGITAVDVWVLALGTLLIFAVSLVQERGADVGAWICRRALPIRWAVLIGGVLCVLLMGIWGSGFSEAAFIYYQF